MYRIGAFAPWRLRTGQSAARITAVLSVLVLVALGIASTVRAAGDECLLPLASAGGKGASGSNTAIPRFTPTAAPAWTLPSDLGGALSLTNFAGKIVLLNFWATWCPFCTNEIPDLVQLQTNYASAGLTVVGISVDAAVGSSPPTSLVANFAAGIHINYPVVMSRPGGTNTEDNYGAIAYPTVGHMEIIPTSFLINPQNQIVQVFQGQQTYSQFETAVRPLLLQNAALTASVTSNAFKIDWPAVNPAFVLEVATNAATNSVWSRIPAALTQTNTVHQSFTSAASSTNQFFRLVSP